MKAVMYHYVRESDNEFPYFKNLHIEDFKKQLDFFESEYGFVTKEAFLEALSTGKSPKGVVLTFDDGIKDHFSNVLPILLERGLWGIFYVSTLMYQEGKLLDVHKIHLLIGKYRAKEVYVKLREVVDDSMLLHGHIAEPTEIMHSKNLNDSYALLVKYILNDILSYEDREKTLDVLMDHFFPNKDEILKSFYITPEEINLIHKEGMIVGSHTVSHPVMSRLSIDEQRGEIVESFDFLEKVPGGLDIKTFCYPYGGFNTFTKDTEKLLTESGCSFSFNLEPRDIDENDLLSRPQALPRYNCNQFQHGQCRDIATYDEE